MIIIGGAKGTIDDNENAYSNGTIIDKPFTNSQGTNINLGSTGFDLDENNKQAIAILNLDLLEPGLE